MMSDAEKFHDELNTTDWRGDCYEATFKLIHYLHLTHRDGFLVHGNAGGIRHAWVELDDTVVDLTVPFSPSPRASYYDWLNVSNTRQYTWTEAAQMLVWCEHYGPWQCEVCGEILDEGECINEDCEKSPYCEAGSRMTGA